jgi:hypothetical protein
MPRNSWFGRLNSGRSVKAFHALRLVVLHLLLMTLM